MDRRLEEVKTASTFDELLAIGESRGFRNSREWADAMMRRRDLRKRCISCGAKQDIDGNLPCGH